MVLPPERYAADLALQETDLPTFLRYFYEQALFPHTRDQVRTFVADPQFDGPLEAAAALTGVTAAEMYAGAPNDPATLRAYWRAMGGEADFRADLARFDVPTFLYYAQPGSIYDQRTAEFVRDQIPGGSELAYSPRQHAHEFPGAEPGRAGRADPGVRRPCVSPPAADPWSATQACRFTVWSSTPPQPTSNLARPSVRLSVLPVFQHQSKAREGSGGV